MAETASKSSEACSCQAAARPSLAHSAPTLETAPSLAQVFPTPRWNTSPAQGGTSHHEPNRNERDDAARVHLWAEVGPNSTNFGRSRPDVCAIPMGVGQMLETPFELDPILADPGPRLAYLCRRRLHFLRFGAALGPIRANVFPTSTELDRIRLAVCQVWSILGPILVTRLARSASPSPHRRQTPGGLVRDAHGGLERHGRAHEQPPVADGRSDGAGEDLDRPALVGLHGIQRRLAAHAALRLDGRPVCCVYV